MALAGCKTKRNKEKQENVVAWIQENLKLEASDAVESLYDRMPLQSGGHLPGIFFPFDGRRREDFRDQGQILDFAVVAGPGRVLDFGPGDGWPSLRLAPLVREVVGVDGSALRTKVCTENAARLGITNTRFVHVPAGCALPFEDSSFDGVTAASSIEQTPDPRATLAELYRVMKPGAKLRMTAETLDAYRGGKEQKVWFSAIGEQTQIVIYDRNPNREVVDHYVLDLDMTKADVAKVLTEFGRKTSLAGLNVKALETLCERLIQAVTWRGRHPSLRTYMGWMREIGFSKIRVTHNGGAIAEAIFERIESKDRFQDMEELNQYLRPIVEAAVEMEAPIGASKPGSLGGFWITGEKAMMK